MTSVLLGLGTTLALAASPGSKPPGSNAGGGLMPQLNPASTQTGVVSNLFWVILALAAVVFLFVVVFLGLNIIRFSGRKGDTEEPKQVYGNRKIEVLWTAIPAAVLLVAFILTVNAMYQINYTTAKASDQVTVVATGHQWWWQFQYPGLGVNTANEFYIPYGKTAVIKIRSVDVLHSFWAPQLGRQMEAIPNQTQTIYMTPTRMGTFAGACYEFCGQGHAWMQFRVIVTSQAKYDAWLAHQRQPAGQSSSPEVLAGENLFFNSSCSSCHTIDGLTTSGVFAPNLTHVASRWSIGGGVLTMSEANLARWVKDPGSYKDGVLMSAFDGFSNKQLKEIAAFLWSLK